MKYLLSILCLFVLSCDDGGDSTEVEGCSDEIACNYNLTVTVDDGSCIYAEGIFSCYGCTNIYAENYNPSILIDDGSCIESSITLYPDFTTIQEMSDSGIEGDLVGPGDVSGACYESDLYRDSFDVDDVDPIEFNFSNPYPNPFNFLSHFNLSIPEQVDLKVFVIDETNTILEYIVDTSVGVSYRKYTWDGASNGVLVPDGYYRIIADFGDYECFHNVKFEDSPYGCTNQSACNYDQYTIIEDNGSCTYAEDNYDCDGICTAEVDECGVCGGLGISTCWDGTEVCDVLDCP